MRTKATTQTAIGALSLALLAGACSGPNTVEQSYTPQQAHPITVAKSSSELAIGVGPDGYEMSDQDRAAIQSLAYNYKARGDGKLTIATPRGSENAGPARVAAKQVVETLDGLGIDQEQIELVTYDAAGQEIPSVILSFERYVALPTNCGNNWSTNTAANSRNSASPNFGCATQNNMAVMLSDPQDLVRARQLGVGYAARRDEVMRKYRLGEPTGATRSDDERATTTQ